ncbi:MAG: Hsp20/alpha crystallin family protein [Candidatus Binatia bacterium]
MSGERRFEEPKDGVEYHRVERLAGKFSRSFYLPQAVKHDGIKATYRDGILEVYVPKADEIRHLLPSQTLLPGRTDNLPGRDFHPLDTQR